MFRILFPHDIPRPGREPGARAERQELGAAAGGGREPGHDAARHDQHRPRRHRGHQVTVSAVQNLVTILYFGE